MKKNLLIAFLFFLLCFTSNNIFAQPAGGSSGAGDGSGATASQPCPTSFKRNNGNGTCGGDAQIRLSFNQLPQFAPQLVAVFYNGVEITSIEMPVEGDVSNLTSKGYVSYCLNGANIPPAKKLVLHFRYEGSDQDDCILVE